MPGKAGAAQLVAATLEAGDDLAAEAAGDAVRLDEDECGFGSHGAGRVVTAAGVVRQLAAAGGGQERRVRSGWSVSVPVTASSGMPAAT